MGGPGARLALDCPACSLGFNPRWGQTLQFQLRAPELVLVRFVVEDYDTTSPNDFVGQFTLPLNSLKQGWRGWKGRGLHLQDPIYLGFGCPPRACPEPGAGGRWFAPPRSWPCRVGGREPDLWLHSPQVTATSTCFPRTGPHCRQPRSSSTSVSSASEGRTDPRWGSWGAGLQPATEALTSSGAVGWREAQPLGPARFAHSTLVSAGCWGLLWSPLRTGHCSFPCDPGALQWPSSSDSWPTPSLWLMKSQACCCQIWGEPVSLQLFSAPQGGRPSLLLPK